MPLIYQNSNKNYMLPMWWPSTRNPQLHRRISDDVPRVLDLLETVNGERVKRGLMSSH